MNCIQEKGYQKYKPKDKQYAKISKKNVTFK